MCWTEKKFCGLNWRKGQGSPGRADLDFVPDNQSGSAGSVQLAEKQNPSQEETLYPRKAVEKPLIKTDVGQGGGAIKLRTTEEWAN